ncbi:hypothetical protein O9929_03555 [Vibrio lentus]|nr:hypothetical protein [Vibrio lentus]
MSTVYCEDSHLLTRVAYHLGSRHVPLQVEAGWVRLSTRSCFSDMKWLKVGRDSDDRKTILCEPEGAYGGRSGIGHHHHH